MRDFLNVFGLMDCEFVCMRLVGKFFTLFICEGF